MKLTKKRAVELHRELWDWLYKNPSKRKYHWPRWKEIGDIRHDCFGCEYDRQFNEDCELCPIVWPGGHCETDNSPYDHWSLADTNATRKKYAGLIRDLPER